MFKPKSKGPGNTTGKILGLLPTAALACSISSAYAAGLPDPALDEPLAHPGTPSESIVVAGGCFWGIQAVFQHVKGVKEAISGYAGGAASTAQYEVVGTGTTGHAESVRITYDPSKITLGKLLKVFFSVAHNPTELNYQGPDHGTQYRSAIFVATPEQRKIAEAYIVQLHEAKIFDQPIVTRLEPLNGFYPAEDYHQNYARLHPDNPYIAINDLPKVANLQKEFPDLYVRP
jgi:peptide-methionine (S)-S-oxide reductase